MRVCSVAGCPRIFPSSEGSRCAEHRREARAARVDNRVYSTKGHRLFRTAVLAKNPICVNCNNALSTIADHFPHTRRELVALGMNPNDPQHGRGLCKPCHDRHTAATTPGGWNA